MPALRAQLIASAIAIGAIVGCGAVPAPLQAGYGKADAERLAPYDVDPEQPRCTNTCELAHNGVCEDDGPGSQSSQCYAGTDCADCGTRELFQYPRYDVPVATVCLAGWGSPGHGANPWFAEICEALADANPAVRLLRDGSEILFEHSDDEGALEALIAELDTDRDGRVTDEDAPMYVAIAGYSWGGVYAAKVAEALLSDRRVDPSRRRVDRLVVIDPYRPLGSDVLEVPPGVNNAWSYRHSVAPERRCAPYEGMPLRCQRSTRCRGHDYSSNPYETVALGRYNQFVEGRAIDHCYVVEAARWDAASNLAVGYGGARRFAEPVDYVN